MPELGSLETSTSHLEIMSPSTSGVFIDGKLKLLCEATLFTIYKRTIQIEILDDTPQLAHVLSPTPSVGKILFCINSYLLFKNFIFGLRAVQFTKNKVK